MSTLLWALLAVATVAVVVFFLVPGTAIAAISAYVALLVGMVTVDRLTKKGWL